MESSRQPQDKLSVEKSLENLQIKTIVRLSSGGRKDNSTIANYFDNIMENIDKSAIESVFKTCSQLESATARAIKRGRLTVSQKVSCCY